MTIATLGVSPRRQYLHDVLRSKSAASGHDRGGGDREAALRTFNVTKPNFGEADNERDGCCFMVDPNIILNGDHHGLPQA